VTEASRPLVEIEGVSFAYGAVPALDGVSLKVDAGDFLALIGPNGSGKSTLVRIMLGLLEPSAGSARLFGEPVSAFRHWERVGYIPQKAASDPGFPASVREVVGLGARGKAPRGAVDEALALTGMQELASRRIGALSGGQQQRAFIARALVSRPALLVLDEPTAGVDSPSQQDFYDLLDRLNRERGITLVLVTHDIAVVSRHVRQVACLNRTLVFHGTHDDFCRNAQMLEWMGGAGGDHLVCHRH
jgi:zinc transport system ATP-binding protein